MGGDWHYEWMYRRGERTLLKTNGVTSYQHVPGSMGERFYPFFSIILTSIA